MVHTLDVARQRLGVNTIDAKARALTAAEAAQSKKGQNLTIIDLTGHETYADYLIIVTAYSERQCLAVAEAVRETFKRELNDRPMNREGNGVWILLDYGDVVVHVFHEDARAYYDLDRIWANAPRVRVPPPLAAAATG
jgi:ribosome-associated protein